MVGNRTRLEALQAARKALQNPCAYIEDVEEERAKVEHSALFRTGNPYATLAAWDGEDDQVVAPSHAPRHQAHQARSETFVDFLSKADFRSECIRIFLPYVPPHLPRRIPQHQRDFIARNERRSGKARYHLVEALRRYDLSTTPGIAPQFNREHSQELSEQKLRQIEAKVADD
jgi:hypothetical protein